MDKQGKNERVSSDFLQRRLIVLYLNIGVAGEVGGWLGG